MAWEFICSALVDSQSILFEGHSTLQMEQLQEENASIRYMYIGGVLIIIIYLRILAVSIFDGSLAGTRRIGTRIVATNLFEVACRV